MSVKHYTINECFYSLQGEGVRAGIAHVILRFSGCNLRCTQATHGFDCDTDYHDGTPCTLAEVVDLVVDTDKHACGWVLLTGGEPTLQLDADLVTALNLAGFKLAIETNGLRPITFDLEWICVSPKVPDRLLRQRRADEVKYVLGANDPLPQCKLDAVHHVLSPAYERRTTTTEQCLDWLPPENLAWCVDLCQKNPQWRLSVQQHKHWKIR